MDGESKRKQNRSKSISPSRKTPSKRLTRRSLREAYSDNDTEHVELPTKNPNVFQQPADEEQMDQVPSPPEAPSPLVEDLVSPAEAEEDLDEVEQLDNLDYTESTAQPIITEPENEAEDDAHEHEEGDDETEGSEEIIIEKAETLSEVVEEDVQMEDADFSEEEEDLVVETMEAESLSAAPTRGPLADLVRNISSSVFGTPLPTVNANAKPKAVETPALNADFYALKSEKMLLDLQLEQRTQEHEKRVADLNRKIIELTEQLQEAKVEAQKAKDASAVVAHAEVAKIQEELQQLNKENFELKNSLKKEEDEVKVLLTKLLSKEEALVNFDSDMEELRKENAKIKNLYKELQMERFNEQQGSVEARFSLNSVSKQNELMKEHLKFMESELKTKSEELIVARRNHNDEIVQIRTELNQKSSELNSALKSVELLKKDKHSVEKLLDDSKQQLIKQKTDAVKREDFLTEEISTLRKMNESLKKKNKEKEESVSRLTKEMETVDSVVNQKVHQMELEMNKINSENQMLKEENSRLKAESVPLIRDFSQVHLDSPGGDRSNFVTVYSNCVKFSNELKALRTEYNHLLQVNKELLVEVNTTRARNEDLTSDKKLVLREYESILGNYDVVKRDYEIVNQDLESLRKDFVVIQRDNDTLRFQLANLIRQMSGETPDGVGAYMEDPVYGRQSETLNVINDNLVKFDDVKELVQKNGELLKITREFGLKLEEHESSSQLNEKKIKEYEAKISDFTGKLTNIKEEYEKKIKDMEIRLHDSGSTSGNSDLRKEYEQYKENALSQMRDLQKDVSSLNAQLLESKMAAVKFETESQMLKERNGFLTESVKNAEKELEIARRDRSQLAKTNEDLEKQVKQSLLRLEDLNNQRRSIENDLTLTKGHLSLLEQDIVRVREEKSELSREKNQLMVLLNTRLQEPGPSSPQRPSNTTQPAVSQRNSQAEDNSVSALEYKSLFSKYEQLMKDYQALNNQYQEEKEKVSKELNKVIKEKEELLEKIRSRPAMTALNSSESSTMEIISLKDQVSSLTNIAKELEEKLNQSEDAKKVLEEEKKQETEKVKEANELSETHVARIKELNSSLDDLKKKNESLETMIETLKDNLATCMDDLKRQSVLAQEANNNYESEIIKHGKNLELLKEAKDSNFKLKQENSNLQQQLDTVKKSIQTEMNSLLEQKEALKKKSDEFDERMKAVKQENDLIKRELLNSGNSGVANNTVLNALRNDLNLLELENQSLTIKNSRLESDLFNVRLELQELQNNMSSSGLDRAAADTDDVQFRLNQLDLLRESNETLRSENKRLESSLEESKKSSQKLKEEKLKIQEMANKLTNDLKFANERISLLEEDNQKWQKRNEQILMKYNQIDPEELVKLENNNQQLSSQLSTKQREIDRLTSTIQSYMKEHESLSKNMTDLLKEHEVLTAKIKDLTANNTQLAKEVSELRIAASTAESNQIQELQDKLQAAEEKLREAEEKYMRYYNSGKGWKAKHDETAKEVAELKTKMENLHGEFEKSIKSIKDEHTHEIASITKRAETKEKLKQSMSDKTIKKLESEKAELQAKLEQFSNGASVSVNKTIDSAPVEVGGISSKRVREDDSFDVSGSSEKLMKLDVVEESPKEQVADKTTKDKPSVVKKFTEKNKDKIPLVFSDTEEAANSRQAVESVGHSNESLEHPAVSESIDGNKPDSEKDSNKMEEDTIDQFLDSIQGEVSSTPLKKKVIEEQASEPTQDMIIPEETLLVEEKLVEPEESVHSEYVPSQGEEEDSDESGELTDSEEEAKPEDKSKPTSPLPDKSTGVPQAPPQPPSNVIVTQTGAVIKKITFDEPAKPAVKSAEKAPKLRASSGGIGRGRSAAALLQQNLPAAKGATRGTKRTRGKK